MNAEKFAEIVQRGMNESLITLTEKAKEYSKDNDRLINFKLAGALDNESPEKALWGMLKKHLVSEGMMISDLEKDIHHGEDKWKEKIIDAINYHYLLLGLLYERYRWFEHEDLG